MNQDLKTMTVPDVAKILQVSEKTITRMLQDGAIPGFKVANQWRFHPDDFELWLRSKRMESDGAARSGIAAMMSQEVESIPLSRLTSEDLITTDLPTGPKEDVLRALIRPLLHKGVVTDERRFLEGLVARERMMSTGVGGRVALPHLRNPQDLPIIHPLVVIGISHAGVDWGSIDKNPVNLFILPVTGNEVIHVKTLGTIRRSLIIDGVVDLFAEAKTPAEVMSILMKIEIIQQNFHE